MSDTDTLLRQVAYEQHLMAPEQTVPDHGLLVQVEQVLGDLTCPGCESRNVDPHPLRNNPKSQHLVFVCRDCGTFQTCGRDEDSWAQRRAEWPPKPPWFWEPGMPYRRIVPDGERWAIMSRNGWLPGRYDTPETAFAAAQLSTDTIVSLATQANEREGWPVHGGTISEAEVHAVA